MEKLKLNEPFELILFGRCSMIGTPYIFMFSYSVFILLLLLAIYTLLYN
jgi:hypothetical protein